MEEATKNYPNRKNLKKSLKTNFVFYDYGRTFEAPH